MGEINLFIGLLVDTLKQFGRAKIWLILFLYFLVNWLVLYAHYDFVSPFFYTLISFWTGFVDSERAVGFTHYPTQFLLMPYFFGWAKLLIGAIIEGAFLGAAALVFANRFLHLDEEERPPVFSVLTRWIHLVIAWVILNGLMLVANDQLQSFFRPFVSGSPRRELALEFLVLPVVYVCILSLLFFAIPSIVVFRENVFKAIKRSLVICIERPIAVILCSALVLVVPVLLSAASGRPAVIVEKFRPELVYWILWIGLVADMVVNFFWMGMATRYLAEEEQ